MNSRKEAMMRLLLIDDELSPSFERPDLQLHGEWVVSCGTTLSDFKFSDFNKQCQAIENPVDLIVAYQDRPKQFPQTEIFRCIELLPLVRMVLVQGPWCDGDLRTPGRVSGPQVMRFDAAELRLAEMIEDFRVGKGILAQPLTALAELPMFSADSKLRSEGLRIGITLPGRLASSAAACIELLGHEAVVLQDCHQTVEGLDLLLVDGDGESFETSNTTGLPRLRLCGFSRRGDQTSLNKTYSLAELGIAIEQIGRSLNGGVRTREPLISQ